MAKTLHITKDNEVVDLTIEEIFNTEKYDEFTGITFSVSPSFLNKYISDFSRISLVVGIPEERVQYGANMAAKNIKAKLEGDLNNEPVKLYQELTTDMKVKVEKSEVELFVPLAHVIHSKFYLLKNSMTGDTRIILGSANLSEQAFNRNTNQFENIIILDNHPLFDKYMEYYHDDLSPILTNYLPEELLTINTKKIKKLDKTNELNIDEVILLSNDDIKRIQEKAVLETFETTEKKVAVGVLPVTVMEEMRNINDNRQEEGRKEREKKKQEDIAYNLVKESISPRAKVPKVKSEATLKKVVRKHVDIKIAKSDDEGLPERPIMVNSQEQRNLSKNISGLFTPSKLDNERLQPVGSFADKDEIKESLANIDRLIRSFENYTVKYDDSYGTRVMEAILYTFTSPYLSEIKKHARSEEERNDIPQFLFLGGTAGSGKSSLLKIIARLTNQPNAIDYNSIIPTGGQRKSQTINAVSSWMSETNVSPLLIDEIPEDFFTNKNYGNELIVNTANRTAYDLKPSPTLIGTTNADGYTLEERARRRSYYLRLDKVFDEMFREESQPVYNSIYNDLNDTLFNDFVLRLAERLSDDSISWANFGATGKIDFMYHSREIFKEYYLESNMPLPRYFPETRYDDSSESNQEKWRKLYLGTSQGDFKFDEMLGNLLFKMAILDENISGYGAGKPSIIYKNALSPKVVVGSKDGTDIELDTPLFFEWINVLNPFEDYYKDNIKEAVTNKKGLYVKDNKNRTATIDVQEIAGTTHSMVTNRYIKYIPIDLVIKTDNSKLIVDSEKFEHWLGIEIKVSLWKRLVA